MVFFDYRLLNVRKVSMHLIKLFAHLDKFFFGQLDGQSLRPCLADNLVLKNLTINCEHKFLLNVTTRDGETNSSAYSWFIGKHFFPLGQFFTSFFAKSSNACLDGWEHNNLSTALSQSVGHVPSSQIRASLAYVEKYCPNEPYFFIA